MVKEGEEPLAEAVLGPSGHPGHAHLMAKAQRTVCICMPVRAYVCKGVPTRAWIMWESLLRRALPLGSPLIPLHTLILLQWPCDSTRDPHGHCCHDPQNWAFQVGAPVLHSSLVTAVLLSAPQTRRTVFQTLAKGALYLP